MRSDADRIQKYDAKVSPTTVGLKIAARMTGMKTGFAGWCDFFVSKESQIQGILNGADVPTLFYPYYLSFGREIGKRTWAGISGDSLLALATAYHDKWVTFGLDTVALKAIAKDVFDITIV